MNKKRDEVANFVATLSLLPLVCQDRVFIAAPFTLLNELKREIEDLKSLVKVGSQDIYFEDKGAFTGEISVSMAQDAGASFALVGHSERRHIFGETDNLISKKVKAALKEDFFPVLCIGETFEERGQGMTETVLERQLVGALKSLTKPPIGMMIAYEPVWAIGTGKVPDIGEVNDIHAFCRSVLVKIFGDSFALAVSILYGGSVSEGNAAEFAACNNIDGLLVGGASLNAGTLSKIVNVCIGKGGTR